MKILNLDVLVPQDKMVKLYEQDIIIPASLPVKYMTTLMGYSQQLEANENSAEAMDGAIDTVIKVFKIRSNKFDEQKIKDNMTLDQYTKIIEFFYETGEQSPQPS